MQVELLSPIVEDKNITGRLMSKSGVVNWGFFPPMHEPPEDENSFRFPRDSFAEDQKRYCADIYAVIELVDCTEKNRMKLTPHNLRIPNFPK